MSQHALRVFDASTLIELFNGHRTVMRYMEEAEAGGMSLVVPALAIAEAQVVIAAPSRMWDHVLAFPGVRVMDLTEHTAIEVGTTASPALRSNAVASTALLGPLMVAQVVYEARTLNAVVLSGLPSAYAGFDVAVTGLHG